MIGGPLNTGVVKIGAAGALAAGRAFKRGWQKSRDERRQREQLLARLASDISRLAEQKEI